MLNILKSQTIEFKQIWKGIPTAVHYPMNTYVSDDEIARVSEAL